MGNPKISSNHKSFYSFIILSFSMYGRRPALSKAVALFQTVKGSYLCTAGSCQNTPPPFPQFPQILGRHNRCLRSASQGGNLTPSPGDISSRVGPSTDPPPPFVFSPEPEVGFSIGRLAFQWLKSLRPAAFPPRRLGQSGYRLYPGCWKCRGVGSFDSLGNRRNGDWLRECEYEWRRIS
jgi:hypothetical protein